jgi:hypothetical protein
MIELLRKPFSTFGQTYSLILRFLRFVSSYLNPLWGRGFDSFFWAFLFAIYFQNEG